MGQTSEGVVTGTKPEATRNFTGGPPGPPGPPPAARARCRPSPTAATHPAVFWEGVVVSSEIPKLPETWFGLKVK